MAKTAKTTKKVGKTNKTEAAAPKKGVKKGAPAKRKNDAVVPIGASAATSGEELERKAAVKKVVLTVNDDELAAWLVEKKYNTTRADAEKLIADIRTEIRDGASGDRREKLGETLARLNEIYKTAIQTMDAKTALAVAKELSKTQRLYNTYEDKESEAVDVEKETARAILETAIPGGETLTLDELAKAMVYRVIHAETRENAKLRGTETRTGTSAKAKSANGGK